MRLIVVDDSKERIERISSMLEKGEVARNIEVVFCKSADEARRALNTLFDMLVLDLLIPKKYNGTPQALHSVSLLRDICDPQGRYIRPNLIVGLTADVDELDAYREEFSRHASIVLDGSLNSIDWLDRLRSQIESLVAKEKKVLVAERDRVLISVHGIRTYGKWQHELGEQVKQYSRSFDLIEIKYGFFDLISFSIPWLRKRRVTSSSARLLALLKQFESKELYIVAHSFGTLIAARAIESLNPAKKIKGVIFCGSPLKSSFNLDAVIASSEVTVNECGTRDLVLVLARLCLLGLGDAGRCGFTRENTASFMNRYFKGGHGLYFKQLDSGEYFYDRYWARFLAIDRSIEKIDMRTNFFGEDIIDLSLKFFTFAKPLVYAGIVYSGIRYIWF